MATESSQAETADLESVPELSRPELVVLENTLLNPDKTNAELAEELGYHPVSVSGVRGRLCDMGVLIKEDETTGYSEYSAPGGLVNLFSSLEDPGSKEDIADIFRRLEEKTDDSEDERCTDREVFGDYLEVLSPFTVPERREIIFELDEDNFDRRDIDERTYDSFTAQSFYRFENLELVERDGGGRTLTDEGEWVRDGLGHLEEEDLLSVLDEDYWDSIGSGSAGTLQVLEGAEGRSFSEIQRIVDIQNIAWNLDTLEEYDLVVDVEPGAFTEYHRTEKGDELLDAVHEFGEFVFEDGYEKITEDTPAEVSKDIVYNTCENNYEPDSQVETLADQAIKHLEKNGETSYIDLAKKLANFALDDGMDITKSTYALRKTGETLMELRETDLRQGRIVTYDPKTDTYSL